VLHLAAVGLSGAAARSHHAALQHLAPDRRTVQSRSVFDLLGRQSLTGLAGLLLTAAAADPGITADRILFGQSAALQGPAAALGIGMREGILAAFSEVNKAGGVNGRSLQLLSINDGYEPDAAIENTRKLIDADHVFALIGEVGTTTSAAAQPIATAGGVPFIAPFTGASFLRDARLRNVINVRASYGQETEAWIRYLVDKRGLRRVAILYQDDSFGRAGLSGVIQALDRRSMKLVAEGTYMRNTTAVKTAFLAIRKSQPDAVVLVGAYKPCADFIRLARRHGLNALFVNISFVGSTALAKELGDDGKDVIVSQVVPLPDDRSIPVVSRYRAALLAAFQHAVPDFVSLEGYVAGLLTIEALKKVGPEVTREKFLAAVYDTGTFDLGGLKLTFGPGDNQGLDDVFLTKIRPGGAFLSVRDTDR
jgi:ABC-type branched-subunit amino acid transport system substrate-binding protein